MRKTAYRGSQDAPMNPSRVNPARDLKQRVDSIRETGGVGMVPPWAEVPSDLTGKVDPVLWLNAAHRAQQLAQSGVRKPPPVEVTKRVYDYLLEGQQQLRARTNAAPPAYEGSPITEGGF